MTGEIVLEGSKAMKILITGTSGSGKSTVGRELKRLGFDVIETDQDTFAGLSIAYWMSKTSGEGVHMPWPPSEGWHNANDWVWRIDILAQRLAAGTGGVVLACGDARNKQEAFSLFDKVFVLTASDRLLRERILARQDNYFGKSEAEFAWVVNQNRLIVDEVLQSGSTPLDANRPPSEIIQDILAETPAGPYGAESTAK